MRRKQTKFIGIFLIIVLGFSGEVVLASEGNDSNHTKVSEYAGNNTIDAKQIIDTVCIKCHNINRIVYSPERDVRDWVQIISFANRSEHFITKAEMFEVVKWLKKHRHELEPAPVDYPELTKIFDPETSAFLKENKCLICHTGERIKQKIGLLDTNEWKSIISRMQSKGPTLLEDLDIGKAATFLSNTHAQIPDEVIESIEEIKDKQKDDEEEFESEFESAFTGEINAKLIINNFCTKCHNINRIAYAPKRGSDEWLKILSSSVEMDQKVKQTLSREEIVEVCNFLASSNQLLEPVTVIKDELKKTLDAETGEMLMTNYCTNCHSAERIIKKAKDLSEKEWMHIIDRMYAKAPGLLNNIDNYKLSAHLYDRYREVEEKGVKKGKGIFRGLFYRTYGSIELWAEERHNYDFNDRTHDDTSAARRQEGFSEGRALVHGELFNPERWRALMAIGGHLLLDRGNNTLDQNFYRREDDAEEADLSLEESWLQVAVRKNLNIKVGLQNYKSDIIGSIYSDTDLGLRLTGAFKGVDWSIYGANRVENDLLSDFNQISDFRDQQIYIGHLQFKVGETIFKPSVHLNMDDEGDHKRGRAGRDEDVEAMYLGLTTYGPIGPVTVLTGLYGVFGNQDNVSLVGAIPLRDQSIKAFLGYLDISYPMMDGKISPHIGALFASGDDDPFDGNAEGFDAISDDVNVWGAKGAIIDDRISLGALGGRTVIRHDSPFPALRDTDANSNYINPGLIAANIGFNTKPFEKFSLDANVTFLWWEETEVLEAILAGLGTPTSIGHSVGAEFNAEAIYQLTDQIRINASGAIFKPHQDMMRIYGDNDLAINAVAGIQFSF